MRSLLPRSGPDGTHADPASPPAGAVPSQPEATAWGFFLVPGDGGSGAGSVGAGAADQGVGAGGGGSGGGGSGKGGPSGSRKPGGGGGGSGLASRGGVGGGGDGSGFADLLRSIRHRIEQARIYPEAARREGIQGTVDLRFRIAADGSVEAMEILRSSGHRILDEASEQTIRRAAPYPRVPGWVRLPLSYRLDR